ncbi:hypothetical protein T484DRAFT_1929379 [Baffinella frigidus]|nr:hypothetical protein T484DRAFT_1929379 [Cryptophyta sp. CCMP2293]
MGILRAVVHRLLHWLGRGFSAGIGAVQHSIRDGPDRSQLSHAPTPSTGLARWASSRPSSTGCEPPAPCHSSRTRAFPASVKPGPE